MSRCIVTTENQAKGPDAQALFQTWLNDLRFPLVYAMRDRESVPHYFSAQLKRPEYLATLRFISTIAVDTKAKSFYDNGVIFDVGEIERAPDKVRGDPRYYYVPYALDLEVGRSRWL